MTDLVYWRCSHCWNAYPAKPERCVNAEAKHRFGHPLCGDYAMVEERVTGVAGDRESRNDDGLTLIVAKQDGSEHTLYFSGDEAWERRKEIIELNAKEGRR